MSAVDVLAAIAAGALVGAVCFDLVELLRTRRPDREDPR